MKKKILLGLSGSVACSKAEMFVVQNSNKFDFKFRSNNEMHPYLELIKELSNLESMY